MNRLYVLADDRRFRWCLALSLILTPLGFGLLGLLWQPRPERVPPAPMRVMRIALLPPPPKRIVVKHIAPKPIKKIPLRPVIVKRPIIPKPRIRPKIRHTRATLRAPSPRPNPRHQSRQAAPGGAASHAPVLAVSPVVSPVAPPTPPTQRPIIVTQKSQVLTPIVPPANVDTPTMPTIPAPDSSGGIGSAAGNGTGNGVGSGHGDGQGAGNGTGGGPFGIGSGGSGTGEGPRHIVYVLDLSGSMTSRIDRARQELKDSLASLGSNESFDIVTFSDEAHMFDETLDPATPFMIQRADYFLTTLQVKGGTNLESALTDALRMRNVNVVFVITDGVPTIDMNGSGIDDAGKYMRWLPRRVRELNVNHARIYTIGLVGKDPDGRDESFEASGMLQQIARDSGGVSKIVPLGDAAP